METGFHGLKVAKSSTGFYVGRCIQEDEAIKQFVRLTDDLSSKQEAIEWIESMMEEVAERKEGLLPLLFFHFKKCTVHNGKFPTTPGIVSLASLCSK
ncbi:hypothetical protein [Bacillus sp. ISL-7]|uniref:hypothetical protein n=1 Tax=Bacillus sp. ISL-7 TaxID=2819136 RepID=UPI001BECD92D|nr:hypothetical protein [Bacillus sp. ISL-7]MBT2733692.1 hypothetical protein [Bacillus sp. ISL-7]